jgi:Bucentaur or craniofacial development
MLIISRQQERRPLTQIGNATADVDSIWARLASLPIGRPPEPLEPKPTENEEDYITIHRTTKFAGQVTTEERRVLKTSQEAKVYLTEQEANKKKQRKEQEAELAEVNAENEEGQFDGPAPPPLRRPLFRKSRFEPNPTGEVKALPPHLQLRWPRDKLPFGKAPGADENAIFNPRALPMLAPAAKLNTVQKSKYDWAGYVDKAGIAEELDQYGKSKQSYAERTGFLNRLEGRKEEERLAAKRKVA